MLEIQKTLKTIEYCTNQLSSGFSISRILSQNITLRLKNIYSIVPSSTKSMKLYDFNSGGIANKMISQQSLSELVYDYMMLNGDLIWIIENNTIFKIYEDELISKFLKTIEYKNEFFQVLKPEKISFDSILTSIKFGGVYPFIGILSIITPNNKEKLMKGGMSEFLLNQIATNTQYVAIGAYDEESYLILELKAI